MALRLTLNHKCGIDATRFSELSALVARASGRPLPSEKPVTGAGIFRHESGIHVRGMLTDARTYEPFAARAVGHRGTEIVLGKHSGTAAIRHVLAKEGVALSTEEARAACWPTCGRRPAGRNVAVYLFEDRFLLIWRDAMKVELVRATQPHDLVLENLPALVRQNPEAKGAAADSPQGGYHCLISRVDNHLVVWDLGGQGGTFVNGVRVAKATLKASDTLRLGDMDFAVRDARPATLRVRRALLSRPRLRLQKAY